MDVATYEVIGIALGIVAVLLILRLAWRGRRVGEGVRCAKCDYLLIGLPETSENCPECGTVVSLATGQNVRTGGRRRAYGWAVVCLMILAAGIWWEQRQARAWFVRSADRKPTWLLLYDAKSPSVIDRQQAIAELFNRDQANGLTTAQHSRLVDCVLANIKTPVQFNGGDIAWLVAQRITGKVSDAQWKQLFDAFPPAYHVRPVISSIEPCRIDQNGGLGWGCTAQAQYVTRSITVDGQPVKVDGRLLNLGQSLPTLSAGRHVLTVVSTARLWGKDFGDGATDQWSGVVNLPFEYRTDGRSTLERVHSPEDVAALKKAIVPEARFNENKELWVNLSFPTNLPVCHDVYVRWAGVEHDLFRVEGGLYSGIGTSRPGIAPVGATAVDLILRPMPSEAVQTPNIRKLVDAEIVYTNVKIAPPPAK